MGVVYVVLAPEKLRSVHATWTECEKMVRGVSGVVFRKVADWGAAAALLRGEGRRLEPGVYAFVDGNHDGGVGVVLVERGRDGRTHDGPAGEISTTVADALPELAEDLPRLRNVLAELAGVAVAVRAALPGTEVRLVHDYTGTAAFVTGAWKAKDPGMIRAVRAIEALIRERQVTLEFVQVTGHQSAIGGDEYALYNQRADRLARQAVSNAV